MTPEFLDLSTFCYFKNFVYVEYYDFIYNPFDSNGLYNFYFYSNNSGSLYSVFTLDYWLHTWLQRKECYYFRCIWHDQMMWYWAHMNNLHNPGFTFYDYMHTPETCVFNYYWSFDSNVLYNESVNYRWSCWKNMYFWYIYSLYPSWYHAAFVEICEESDWYSQISFVLPLDIFWFNDSNYYIYPDLFLYCSNNLFVILYDRLINIFLLLGLNFIFKYFFFVSLYLKYLIGFFIFIFLFYFFRHFLNIFNYRQFFLKIIHNIQNSILFQFFNKGPAIEKKWRILTIYYDWQFLGAMKKDLSEHKYIYKKLNFLGKNYFFMTLVLSLGVIFRGIYIFFFSIIFFFSNCFSFYFFRFFDYYYIYYIYFYLRIYFYFYLIIFCRYFKDSFFYPFWRWIIPILNKFIFITFNETYFAFIRAVFFFYHKVPFYLNKDNYNLNAMDHSNFFYLMFSKIVGVIRLNDHIKVKNTKNKTLFSISAVYIITFIYFLFELIIYIIQKLNLISLIYIIDFIQYYKKKIIRYFVIRRFSFYILSLLIFYLFSVKFILLMLVLIFFSFFFLSFFVNFLIKINLIFIDYFFYFIGLLVYYLFYFFIFSLRSLFLLFFVLLFRFKFFWLFLFFFFFGIDLNFISSFLYQVLYYFPTHLIYYFFFNIADVVLRFHVLFNDSIVVQKFFFCDGIDALNLLIKNYIHYVDRCEFRFKYFFNRLYYQEYYSPYYFKFDIFRFSLAHFRHIIFLLKQLLYFFVIKILYFYWAKLWITPWVFIMTQAFYWLWWPIYCFYIMFFNINDSSHIIYIYLSWLWFFFVPYYFMSYFIDFYYFFNSFCFIFKYCYFINFYCSFLEFKTILFSSSIYINWSDFTSVVYLYFVFFKIIIKTLFFNFWTFLNLLLFDLFFPLFNYLNYNTIGSLNGFYYLKIIQLFLYEWSDKFYSYFRISPIWIEKHFSDYNNHSYLRLVKKYKSRFHFYGLPTLKKDNIFNILEGYRCFNWLVFLRKPYFYFKLFDLWEIYMLNLININLHYLFSILLFIEFFSLFILMSFILKLGRYFSVKSNFICNSKFLWSAFRLNAIKDSFSWLRDDFSLYILEKYSSAFIEDEINLPESLKMKRNISLKSDEFLTNYMDFIKVEKQKLSELLVSYDRKNFSIIKRKKLSKKHLKKDINRFKSFFKTLLKYEKKKFGGEINNSFLKDFESSLNFDYKQFFYSKNYSNFNFVFSNESSKLDIFLAYGFRHNIYLNNLYNQLMLTKKAALALNTWFDIEKQLSESLFNFFFRIDNICLSLKGVNWLWHRDLGSNFIVKTTNKTSGSDLVYLESDPIIYDRGFIWLLIVPYSLLRCYFRFEGLGFILSGQEFSTAIFLKIFLSQITLMYDLYDSFGVFSWSFLGHDYNCPQVEFHRFVTFHYHDFDYLKNIDPLWSYYVIYKERNQLNYLFLYDLFFSSYWSISCFKGDFNILVFDFFRYFSFFFFNLIWFFFKRNYIIVYFNHVYNYTNLLQDIRYFYCLPKNKFNRYFKKTKISK